MFGSTVFGDQIVLGNNQKSGKENFLDPPLTLKFKLFFLLSQ